MMHTLTMKDHPEVSASAKWFLLTFQDLFPPFYPRYTYMPPLKKKLTFSLSSFVC